MLESLEKKMNKCLDALKDSFLKVIANRITPSILDDLYIKIDKNNYKINQLSTISKDSGNSLLLKPFDKKNISLIYDAISNSNLHLNPLIVKDNIRVVFPKMTEDRRRLLVKNIRSLSENAKISIRNIRRDFNKKIKIDLKNSLISINDEKIYSKQIQDLTNEYIKKIELETSIKEKELMKV